MRTHKSNGYEGLWGTSALCGKWPIQMRTARYWRQVTCAACLKKRAKQSAAEEGVKK